MPKINWTLRLRNKATLIAIVTTTLAFAYTMLGLFGVVPPVAETEITQVLLALIEVLGAFGIFVDPTTEGIGDSEEALAYTEPKKSEKNPQKD